MAAGVGSTEEEEMKFPTKQRKVVVTGLGVVSPIGHDPDIFYNNLLGGVSGISHIEAFDCSKFPTVHVISLLPICLTVTSPH